MLKGWIVGGPVATEKLEGDRQMTILSLLEEAAKHDMEIEYKSVWQIVKDMNDIASGKISAPDFHVYSNPTITQMLEQYGTVGFNSSTAALNCRDKFRTYIVLNQAGILQPKTFGMVSVHHSITKSDLANYFDDLCDVLGLPFIGKETVGSLGKSVFLISSFDDFLDFVKHLSKRNAKGLVQELISESWGRDLRLHVIGDRVIGAIERSSNDKSEFRANIALGGSGKTYEPSPTEQEIAIAATKACGCSHAGVDLLATSDNVYVCEINSQAHFFTKEECDVNTAEILLEYIRKQLDFLK